MTLPDLLTAGEREGILTPEQSSRALAAAAEEAARESTPWYLHMVLAVGAWCTSFFMLAFIYGAFEQALKSHQFGLVLGLGIIAGATVWRNFAQGAFPRQLCLALSTSGHVLFFYETLELADHSALNPFTTFTLCALVLAAVLYPLYPDRLHRFLSTGFALGATTFWIQQQSNPHLNFGPGEPVDLSRLLLWFQASVAVHLGLLYFIFGRAGARVRWRPLGYAAAVSLLGVFFVPAAFGSIGFRSYGEGAGLSSLLIGLATLLSAGGWQRARRNRQVWLALIIALFVMAFTAGPATLLSLFFLVLGFGLQDRAFLTLGTLLLPTFLFFHYYNLGQTLVVKSMYLLATGLVLLALRYTLTRVRWEGTPTTS